MAKRQITSFFFLLLNTICISICQSPVCLLLPPPPSCLCHIFRMRLQAVTHAHSDSLSLVGASAKPCIQSSLLFCPPARGSLLRLRLIWFTFCTPTSSSLSWALTQSPSISTPLRPSSLRLPSPPLPSFQRPPSPQLRPSGPLLGLPRPYQRLPCRSQPYQQPPSLLPYPRLPCLQLPCPQLPSRLQLCQQLPSQQLPFLLPPFALLPCLLQGRRGQQSVRGRGLQWAQVLWALLRLPGVLLRPGM
mmetsp:Transcript_33087/g.65641  ORF Transcript_33087/g.65641 Transcript_33087/m.65641 type:complete len:246 (+) Transcript_33087:991-1728(+)